MLEFIAKLVQHVNGEIVDLKVLGGLHVKESQLLTDATRIRIRNHIDNLLQGMPILAEQPEKRPLYLQFLQQLIQSPDFYNRASIETIYQHNDELTIKFKLQSPKADNVQT